MMNKKIYVFFGLLWLLSACGNAQATISHTPTSAATITPTAIITPVAPAGDEAGLTELIESVPTRTPEPTATPDALAENITRIVEGTQFADELLFWLQVEDWINLGVSLLVVLGGYLFGFWFVGWLLPRIVRRTANQLDDHLLAVSGTELRWLVLVIALQLATDRLSFISSDSKTVLSDIYFLLAFALLATLAWRLIQLATEEARKRAVNAGRQEELNSLITLYAWVLRLVVIILGISILLTYFGVNITGFALMLGIGMLVISLAGRDTLTDVVAGAMILIDRPYRIGDRVELPGIDFWGDVVDIGMRSTQILARNNRMVIVPNSQMGTARIANYSYPNSQYRLQSDIGVAYDNDIAEVSDLLLEAVRQVEGVLVDHPIEVLLLEFRENEIIFRARWWIKSYQDYFAILNRCNRAMITALKNAGVDFPFMATNVKFDTKPEEMENLTSHLDGKAGEET